MTKKQNSFTLLELLVVIAIIALLIVISSSVYMQYREAGRQSGITSYLVQTRRVANVIESTALSYEGLCDDSDFETIKKEIKSLNHGRDVSCKASQNKYCVSTEVKDGKYFCFDSATGFVEFKVCNPLTIACE